LLLVTHSTSFGAWISAEEDFDFLAGQAWQVDPTGERAPQVITLGKDGGAFEAFAYDERDRNNSQYFLSEDIPDGPIQRFRPSNPDWNNPWGILLGDGIVDYLVLSPMSDNPSNGTFSWTSNKNEARSSAAQNYPNTEGIAVIGNLMYFVSKVTYFMFTLNLDTGTYSRSPTYTGLFDGEPDQLKNMFANDNSNNDTLLFFTEDGGQRAGIHQRDAWHGTFTTILEGLYDPETTGLSFSPDGTRLLFAFQNDGIVFEVKRKDGMPFHAKTINVKRHPSGAKDSERRRR
jgi:hypothetical protein